MGTRKFRTPGSAQQSALEAAKNLMAERLKYEQWLDDLEAKKEATPAKVYERVQKDYLDRLQNVVEQLSKYTETLEQYAETLAGKLSDLQAMEEANEEEQAEAALRKQVGEMSSSEWESSSRKAQKELAKIKENQVTIESDLDQIRDLLGDVEVAEDEPPAKSSKGSKDFNELEFLSSVVGQSTAPIPAGKPPESRASGPSTPPKTPTPAAAAQVARSTPAPGTTPAAPRVSNPPAQPTPSQAAPAQPRTSSPAAAAPPASSTPTPSATPAQPAPAPAAATPAPPAAAAPVAAEPAEPPSAHRPTVATEQAKTLKCTECSTMNYPTEWYCERCGAELTGA